MINKEKTEELIMSKTMSFPVSGDFNLEKFTAEFTEYYRAKQYEVSAMPEGRAAMRIEIGKNSDGIMYYLGLGMKAEISVTLSEFSSGQKNIAFEINDAAFVVRIVDLVVGWFLCLVPFITGLIGFVNNSEFMKGLESQIRRMVQEQC